MLNMFNIIMTCYSQHQKHLQHFIHILGKLDLKKDNVEYSRVWLMRHMDHNYVHM